MSALVTDAIVLHAIDYQESSRIFRLVTREAGVQSVLARNARTSRKRFGSALDLFAEGQAQLSVKPGRDLHTLESFDVRRARPELAADLGRFTAAAALAECVLRVVHDEAASRVYDIVADALARIGRSEGDRVVAETLGAIWRVVAEIGMAPALRFCASCHTSIAMDREVQFSHRAGGVLCDECAARVLGARRLPAEARRNLLAWLDATPAEPLARPHERAHQRLLREFLVEHVADGRPLRAYLLWEEAAWTDTGPVNLADL